MDIGALLAQTQLAQPQPAATPYARALLAQSRLPQTLPQNRSFPVPLSFRPNMTKAGGISASPAPNPTAPQSSALGTRPLPVTAGRKIATSPTKISTPFSDYRGKTMGSPSGHMANTPGFSS